MSVFKRGNVFWAEFQMGSERVRQSTGETNERKAKQIEAELKTEMKARLKGGHARITLGEALRQYTASVISGGHTSIPGGRIGDSELRIYPLIVSRFGEDTLLDDITGPKIAKWRDDMLAGGALVPVKGGKRGEKRADPDKAFKPASVARYIEALRSVLSKAHSDWGCLQMMPSFDAVKPSKGKTVWLEKVEDQDKLLAACPEHFRPFILFLLGTGARCSEGLFLTWSNLDISPNRDEAQATFPMTKNGAPRSVPLPSAVRDMLLELRSRKPADEERVFLWADPKQGGKRVPFNSPKVTMGAAVRRASLSIKGVTLHTMRHTYASLLVKEGVDLYAVSKLLGHASIKMTERYAHLAPSKLGGVVSILNGRLAA